MTCHQNPWPGNYAKELNDCYNWWFYISCSVIEEAWSICYVSCGRMIIKSITRLCHCSLQTNTWNNWIISVKDLQRNICRSVTFRSQIACLQVIVVSTARQSSLRWTLSKIPDVANVTCLYFWMHTALVFSRQGHALWFCGELDCPLKRNLRVFLKSYPLLKKSKFYEVFRSIKYVISIH